MKKVIIAIFLVAVIAGIGYFGFSSQTLAAPNNSPAQSQAGTKLVIIAEDVTLPAGIQGPDFLSGYIDVRAYNQFKIFAKLTPGPLAPPPPGPMNPPIELPVRVTLQENPTGEGPSYGGFHSFNVWRQLTTPTGQERYAAVESFNGLYSYISCVAMNDGIEDVQISLYLLMDKE